MKYLLIVLSLFTITACQQSEPIQIGHAWVRAPAPGQVVAAAYMEIKSVSDVALTQVSSDVAQICEIHSMTMDKGIMRMRMLPQLNIPAQQSVFLAPGKTHVMLIDLNHDLKLGEQVPITLTFTRPDGSQIQRTLSLPVQAE
jgi:copper(I)-binding protein